MTAWLTGWINRPLWTTHRARTPTTAACRRPDRPNSPRCTKAKGADFEPMFLNLFVAHQHNAVEMAHLETTDGVNTETKAFADRVRESRADQIRQMLTLMNP